MNRQSIYEAAGGREGLLRLASAWHSRVLEDEVVSHAFSHGYHPQHTERLAAYWAEALGGPTTYSERYGDETSVVRIHSGNGPHEEMDQRAIACFDRALEDIGLARDEPLWGVLHDYFAWATNNTMARYHRSSDDVPDGLHIPKWSWHGLVSVPPPVLLAQDLAPTLRGLDWGIGGSSLLWKLGLADAPRDLDLVTTAAHFPEVRRLISLKLGDSSDTPHPVYRSRYFARFAPMGPVSVDLFAEVRVEKSNGILEWAFDPAALELRDGLPWMRAEDWVQLYKLFDRPTRVKVLTDYLAGRGSVSRGE